MFLFLQKFFISDILIKSGQDLLNKINNENGFEKVGFVSSSMSIDNKFIGLALIRKKFFSLDEIELLDDLGKVILLNPIGEKKIAYLEKCLGKTEGPILAASDYMRMNADQIRPYTSKSFYSLGTDGYGRSDTSKNLRSFFEIDKQHIVAYGLSVLANEQLIASKYAEQAIRKYNINKNKPMPTKL